MGEKSDRDIKRLKNIVGKVPEDSKIQLDQMIKEFLSLSDLKEITFPKLLSSMERAYVHYQASKHGLTSASSGSGTERRLTLRRATESTSIDFQLVTFTPDSLLTIGKLCNAYPAPTNRPAMGNSTGYPKHGAELVTSPSSRLCIGPFPKVPKRRRSNAFLQTRIRLPIWQHQQEILKALKDNRVTFIRGSTGCGKTTQVGQYILDEASVYSKKVRIICTVPRRIAAVSVSERVAMERGERLGQTVGYQIRLESCLSPVETLLTYCTSGILLRSLSSAMSTTTDSASDYDILSNTTHIIIDEIHERDRQTDFLLACLKGILGQFPNLRLILMGANLNDELFTSYFGGEFNCPVIDVEGRIFPVDVFYLEDTLELLNYENHDMRCSRKENDHGGSTYSRLIQKLRGDADLGIQKGNASRGGPNPKADVLIQNFWISGEHDIFEDFMGMVQDYSVSVDYQHSREQVTMLMAAAVRGELDLVERLLNLGADMSIKSKIEEAEFSAIDWATDHRQHEVLKYLLEHQYQNRRLAPASGGNTSFMDKAKNQRLEKYLRSIDEERVDLLLIVRLLQRIHRDCDTSHAILVFLPGYDEIVNLKHLILTDNQGGFHAGTFLVFMLHSNIQTGDQRAAFERPPSGVRKIVLATNIAESSLTIEDIVFVVDSGKAKEKSFDSMTGVTQLKSVWISKASADQRRGRAGRCRTGVCYRLFSSARYDAMAEYPIPEIVRTSLQELCLQARSFLKPGMRIDQFFNRIPEPPAPIAVIKSVELLKTMGALDENEMLTRLGFHLLEFPLEPFLGKALIYAVVFKCLDPILTLVSIISYRDPFQLPSNPKDKQRAQECKAQFARESYSDHMAYMKAFQDWEKSKLFALDRVERAFCQDNFLSSNTFEMVYAIRAQLLGQLRGAGFVQTKGKGDLQQLNENSNNWALVKGVLVSTLYPNICGVNRQKNVMYNSFNSKVFFHPSTTLTKRRDGVKDIPTDWIIFDEMTQQGHANLVKGCTCVVTPAIALFAGSFTSTDTVADPGEADLLASIGENGEGVSVTPSRVIKINQWISLRGSRSTIESVVYLRRKIHEMVLKRLENPGAQVTLEDENVVGTVARILVNEDAASGFKNIEGIEQWPKLVSGNLMSTPKAGFVKPPTEPKVEGDSQGTRYFIIEVDDIRVVVEIMKSRLWLVPELLKSKFAVNNNEVEDQGGTAVIFFWIPSKNQFSGSIRVKNVSTFGFLSEVPVDIIGTSIIDRQIAEHEIGFKTPQNVPVHGLELEKELGVALLKMFLG